jgi:hypothetical protein
MITCQSKNLIVPDIHLPKYYNLNTKSPQQNCSRCAAIADITAVSQQCCNSAASKWSSDGAQGENSSQLSAEMKHIQSTNAALTPWEQVLQFGKRTTPKFEHC